MSVFPICINTWLGVTAVPKSLIDVGKSFVASPQTILRRIVLPATLPYIMAGIRLAVGRGVVAMIIAEFFTAISGLGAIIINSANNFDTARMFVPVVVLMVLATALTGLIGWIERKVAPWQAEIAGRDRELARRRPAPMSNAATSSKAMKAIVVGGGIGGLTLALSLHQAGIEVWVYEAVRDLAPLGSRHQSAAGGGARAHRAWAGATNSRVTGIATQRLELASTSSDS